MNSCCTSGFGAARPHLLLRDSLESRTSRSSSSALQATTSLIPQVLDDIVVRGSAAAGPAAGDFFLVESSSPLSSHHLSLSLVVSAANDEGGLRQYVSLVVIGLVLVDILLGSPFANKVLSFARPPEQDGFDRNSGDGDKDTRGGGAAVDGPTTTRRTSGGTANKSRERIDVDSFAKAAIEKAEGVAELREYLDAQKTDWDRMEELKREMDDQMDRLDEKGIGGDGGTGRGS